MPDNTQRIEYLFKQYMNKTCSRDELQELFDYIGRPEYRDLLEQMMDAEFEVLQPLAAAQDVDWEYIYQQVTKEEGNNLYPLPDKRRFHWLSMAAAAVIILTLGLGAYWWFNRAPKQQMAKTNQPAKNTPHDIMPGSNKAVLTLANGSSIILDSAHNGLLSQEGNTNVIKSGNGEVAYKPSGAGTNAVMAYNILSTPRGGQYKIQLPDGTTVWLNAASTIKYPVAFTGNERKVELSGEAYFEVTKDASKPFKVAILPSAGNIGAEVEVLGTHFNVNAYGDEPAIATTLLEGKVKMLSMVNREWATIKPGEQAIATSYSPLTIDHSPDIELTMAWKNGFTAFKSADIKSIMRQVARWYDVDVEFEGVIPERSFTGGVSRNANLSELLRLLEVSKVHFRLEGKKLIVTG